MFVLVKNETDIENCSGRKKLFELINDSGKDGSKYSCAFETMNTPECGRSFFFGERGYGDRMCYCETVGSSCPRTSSTQFTEYRLIDGKLIINDFIIALRRQKSSTRFQYRTSLFLLKITDGITTTTKLTSTTTIPLTTTLQGI